MKISNVIKALNKIGLQVEQRVNCSKNNTFFYLCKSKKEVASWYEQPHDNGETDSVYIRPIDKQDDITTDYFCGSFYHTIKSIIKVMSE